MIIIDDFVPDRFAITIDEIESDSRGGKEKYKEWIRIVEKRFNEILNFRQNATGHGYIFLNEVYDWFNAKRTKAGQLVGWRYKKGDPNHIRFSVVEDGDNLIVSFNIDGIIIEELDKPIEPKPSL